MTNIIYCEGCGEAGGKHEDPYYPGEDDLIDICTPCLRHRRRQAAIDARQAEFADMDPARAEALIGAL
ncbi:hypothetical protein ABZ749_00935 [Micromonospora sp. NPDC047753]|uniref:hypothetical protein n=1 Tax=Micromonospora sp. NPDC047753 TaxID=3154817 RepID=UPI00340ED33D